MKNSEKDLSFWVQELKNPNKSDSALQELKELETDKDDIKGLKAFLSDNNDDIDSLNDFLERNKKPNFNYKPRRKNSFVPIGIAASILLVIGFYFIANRETPVEKYRIYDPGLPVLMNSNLNHEKGNWMQEYKSKNYDLALTKGNVLLQKLPNNDTLLYYQGIIQMNLDNLEGAISNFERVMELNHSTFLVPTKYNLALCYLSFEREEEAVTLLKSVAKSYDDEYASSAEKVLRKERLQQ